MKRDRVSCKQIQDLSRCQNSNCDHDSSIFSCLSEWTLGTAFNWRAYANRCDSLRLLRYNKIRMDTLISTSDSSFSEEVHWQVIEALCPRLLDASNRSEGPQDRTVMRFCYGSWSRIKSYVKLPENVDYQFARLLIDCAYGEPIRLDRCMLYKIYKLSLEYQIDHVLEMCLDYARNLLNAHTCVRLLFLGIRHRHDRLIRSAYISLRSNFKLVLIRNRDIHHLPFSYMKRLLNDDFLKISQEEELAWIAILRWKTGKLFEVAELIQIYYQMISPMSFQSSVFSPLARNARPLWCERNLQQLQPREISLDFMTRFISESNETRAPRQQQQLAPSNSLDFNELNSSRVSRGLDDINNRVVEQLTSHILGNKQLVSINRKSTEEFSELIRSLRFFRFRSVSAFNVILDVDFVKESEQLTLLANHMKLRYMIRRGIRLDNEDQLKALFSTATLAKIKKSEITKSRRFLSALGKLLNFRQTANARQETSSGSTLPASNQLDRRRELEHRKQLVSRREDTETISAKKLSKTNNQRISTSNQMDGRAKVAADIVKDLNPNQLRRAREPRVPDSVAIIVGGWQEGRVRNSMLAYDYICDKWFKLNISLPEPRAFHAACTKQDTGEIYIFGGTNGAEILNSVIRFSLARDVFLRHKVIASSKLNNHHRGATEKNGASKSREARICIKFHILAPMKERRCHLSGVLHSDGHLYAIGGHNGLQRLRTCERYDMKRNEWSPISEMSMTRSDASACSHENKIFVAGGQISDQFVQASVEFYKHTDDTWTFATPMIVPRMAFSLTSYKNELYAIGGTNDIIGGEEFFSVTRSVERYNPRLATWSLCSPMSQKRSSFGSMFIADKLIIVGGHTGQRRLKTSEQMLLGQIIVVNNGQETVGLDGQAQSLAPRQAQQVQQVEQTQQASNYHQAQQIAGIASWIRPSLGEERGPRSPLGYRPLRREPISSNDRTMMKWVRRANLPTKRSGFTISVVDNLPNAHHYTYHGSRVRQKGQQSLGQQAFRSANQATIIKQKTRWHKFKIIRRRKLMKHLKIGLVVSLVILIM